MISTLHRFCLTLLLLLLALVVPAVAGAQPSLPPLPPLTSPASEQHLPGKFVWADLFSSDLERSQRFYQELFGWEFRWVSEPPQPYGIFSVDGVDVAGLAYREVKNAGVYARWVHYVSVRDIGRSVTVLESAGGRTLLNADVEQRGAFAIFSFPSTALLGVMRSSTGDPEDFRAEMGEWIWRQLYVRDLQRTVTLLQDLTDYEVEANTSSEEVDRYLISEGYVRAGLAELPAESKAAPTWVGFIRVEDVAAVAAKAATLGGKVQHTADSQDMAIISDPNGALIGVLSYDYPEDAGAQEQAQ